MQEQILAGKKYAYQYDEAEKSIKILPISGSYLFQIGSFDGKTLNSASIELVYTVTAEKETADKLLTKITTMKYEPTEENDKNIKDKDSNSDPSNLLLSTNQKERAMYSGSENNKGYLGDSTYYYKGQEDDDDFEKAVIKGIPFDLTLRQYVSKINGEEIKNRIPTIDTSKINTVDETTGESIETAEYTQIKQPIAVRRGDIITFTIRVYNEGQLDGYATKISEYLPEGLGYLLDYKENTNNLWRIVNDGNVSTMPLVGTEGLYETEDAIKNLRAKDFESAIKEYKSLEEVNILKGKAKITTTYLEDEIIKAYNPTATESETSTTEKWQKSNNGEDGLYYQEVEITCIVIADNSFDGVIKNMVEVEADKAVDENRNEIMAEDRDSTPGNTTNYEPIIEDDYDFEQLKLKQFDLAMQTFVSQVESLEGTKTEAQREPTIEVNERGNIYYTKKNPATRVENSDIITYKIRVYNEGTILGSAIEVSGDIPDGLIFLKDNPINNQYGWKMYDIKGEETQDIQKAVEVRTNYLQETVINIYDPTIGIKITEDHNPDYAEVELIFQVVEKNVLKEDRIITTKAQIIKSKALDAEQNEIEIKDEDSKTGEWIEGEDDQSIEEVYLKKFDLALKQWVNQTIITVNNRTTTTDTGFDQNTTAEAMAKILINKNDIEKAQVKVIYNIQVVNQGEIEGYATEITEYIPEGLTFIEEENSMWKKESEEKIKTRALEDKNLKPGETAIVPVVLRWENSSKNLGTKTIIAEITEDYNKKGAKDIDSTVNNKETNENEEKLEDDEAKAVIKIEVKRKWQTVMYFGLVIIVIAILTTGIILIKRIGI